MMKEVETGMRERENFQSRLGFILVSAGCAIGIGNVWKFPYVTGANGGGIFVLFYLLFLSVRQFRTAGARNNWVPLLAAFLIIGSVVMDTFIGKPEQPVSFLTMAIVLSGVRILSGNMSTI